MASFKRPKVQPFRIPESLRAKWPVELLTEGYVPCPKTFLRCMGRILDGPHALAELAILLAVIDCKRLEADKHPSVDFIAFVAGREVPETLETLVRLQRRNLISIDGTHGELTIDTGGLFEAITVQLRV